MLTVPLTSSVKTTGGCGCLVCYLFLSAVQLPELSAITRSMVNGKLGGKFRLPDQEANSISVTTRW